MYPRKQATPKKNSTRWPFVFKLRPKYSDWLKGLWAEKLASLWLQFHRYRICARRFKTPLGEIDLIAYKSNTLIAVEVKARSTDEQALAAITTTQQRRIQQALSLFLQQYEIYAGSDLRFDVVVIKPWSWPRHLIHAWEAQ